MEALKRLTCRVEGQIGVREFLWETRVARLAECRLEQKAGYDQHTSPSLLNENELTNLGASTITSYLVSFSRYQL